MKALSLRQPWCWTVTHKNKRIENRRWVQLRRGMAGISNMIQPGETFALHASSTKIKPSDAMAIVDVLPTVDLSDPASNLLGYITGLATIVDVVRTEDSKVYTRTDSGWPMYELNAQDRDRIVYCDDRQWRDVRGINDRQQQIDDWWMGPYALVLDQVTRLPTPIACKGFLYFWDVPPVIEAQIKEQCG